MRRTVLLACLATALFSAGCACTPEPLSSQAVSLRGQETPVWCWAASGEMCMDFLGTDVSQCDEANKRFGRTDCCNSPRPSQCVNPGWPEFDKYNFTFNRTHDAALTWDQLKEQIYCKHKPFAFSWHWNNGGGHMMVVKGYAEVGGEHWVYYDNPLPVGSGAHEFKTYANWVSGSTYTHWDDFYDITKK